jgi:hypothetical protein
MGARAIDFVIPWILWTFAMDYKTVFVPLAGKVPTKYAEQLPKQLSDLSSDGYETIAITPLNHADRSTTGLLITARKPAQ